MWDDRTDAVTERSDLIDYDGIDPHAFRPLIRVHLAGHRYPGWIHTPSKATQLQLTEVASYERTA